MLKITGFADEISQDPKVQIATLQSESNLPPRDRIVHLGHQDICDDHIVIAFPYGVESRLWRRRE